MKRGVIAFTRPNQRHVHAHKIGSGQRLLKFRILDAGAFFLQPAIVPEVHQLLDPAHKAMILIGRVEAQDVHVEASAFANHCLPDAPGTDDRDGLAGYFIAQKRQEGMPRSPQVLAHLLLT